MVFSSQLCEEENATSTKVDQRELWCERKARKIYSKNS